ncbi:MAG: hypothetical protein QOI68_2084 [Pseudonocardiales bacterium]|nr:hypothetical protein [Pseudonocardiales bacterium]
MSLVWCPARRPTGLGPTAPCSGSVRGISPLPRRARPVLGCVLLTAALLGCAPRPATPAVDTAAPVPAATGTPEAAAAPAPAPAVSAAAPAPADCTNGTAWSCDQQRRFAAASAYVARSGGGHGYLSAVFTDRRTGLSWRVGPARQPGWTASTIKLAIATDLVERGRAGAITLTAADRHDMDAMLANSDEPASNRLWAKYGDDAMLARFRERFGMPGVRFVPGFSTRAYWGFVKCTSDDLAALVRHILTVTDPADRGYLVAAMRAVAPNQRWGVWAAGAGNQPGNKDGWSFESDSYGKHWVADSVGFAGPGERYVVAVMYQVDPRGTLADGVHAVSDLVALLFGQPVPAPVTVPAPDG